MDPFMALLGLCFTMFVGSYSSGLVPMVFALSERVKRIVAVFGAGLLVGAALVVIIPEGIHLWYEAVAHDAELQAHAHVHEGHGDEHASDAHAHGDGGSGEDGHEHSGHSHGHWQIGASLVAGFGAMLLIDRAGGGHGHGHSHGGGGGHSHGSGGGSASSGAGGSGSEPNAGLAGVGVDAEGGSADDGPASDGDAGALLGGGGSGGNGGTADAGGDGRNTSAMIGLVAHSAADGVAMGAACFANSTGMETVVFLAIMLHKMPAALGFSSYLVAQGLPQEKIKQQLLIFALAAPVGAIVTYEALNIGVVEYAQRNLAVCLMLSGGTFLYVATAHILPEVQAAGQLEARPEDNKPAAAAPWSDVWIMIAGLVMPMLINVDHAH